MGVVSFAVKILSSFIRLKIKLSKVLCHLQEQCIIKLLELFFLLLFSVIAE
jgi:hypothetical protein